MTVGLIVLGVGDIVLLASAVTLTCFVGAACPSQSLKVLRETDLKPYVIFVSPPNTEKLRQLTTFLGKPQLAVRDVDP